MNGVQGVEGSNPFIPTRKQKPQGIYGNVDPFSVLGPEDSGSVFVLRARRREKPVLEDTAGHMCFTLHAGPFLPGVTCGCVFLCRVFAMRDADSRLAQGDAARCMRISLYKKARSAPAGMVSAGRAPARWGNGDLRSTALPFFAQKGEGSYFEKM